MKKIYYAVGLFLGILVVLLILLEIGGRTTSFNKEGQFLVMYGLLTVAAGVFTAVAMSDLYKEGEDDEHERKYG